MLTIALISYASEVMLKILQARLQQYVNWDLPDVQVGFSKGGGTRDQIANIHLIIEKATEFQKNIYFCFIDYPKAFDCVYHTKLWKILKEMGIPDQRPEFWFFYRDPIQEEDRHVKGGIDGNLFFYCLWSQLYSFEPIVVGNVNGPNWSSIPR